MNFYKFRFTKNIQDLLCVEKDNKLLNSLMMIKITRNLTGNNQKISAQINSIYLNFSCQSLFFKFSKRQIEIPKFSFSSSKKVKKIKEIKEIKVEIKQINEKSPKILGEASLKKTLLKTEIIANIDYHQFGCYLNDPIFLSQLNALKMEINPTLTYEGFFDGGTITSTGMVV